MSEAAQRASPAHIAPGAVLAGRFRLDGLLGSGGMAEVWRALDQATGRPVAVKLLRPQVAASQEAVQRLKREGEVLSALSHPAIVRVETYGQLDGGIVFLAMELLDGETLGARMRRGRMEPLELAPIVAGTCAGLAAAHARSIVHRDLKPDNIFLAGATATGEPLVKVLDFGISKVYGGDRLTYTGEVLGTPRYMSPEQLGTEPEIDLRVDVYAMGVILYEAMAGKPPFLAASATDLIVSILHGKIVPLRSLRPDLPAALEAVVMRAMARAREARYASAADLGDAFLDAAGATARARALPKPKVMRTQALGGAGGISSLPPMPGGRASSPDLLRPGTFSAFDAVDESAVRNARSLPYDETAMAPSTAPAAPASASPAYAPPVVQHAPPPSVVAAHAPSVPHAPPRPAPRAESAVGSLAARIALVAAGLLAGAVSMAIVIAALHFLRVGETPPPPPAPTPPESTAPAPEPAPPPDPATVPETEPSADPAPTSEEPAASAEPTEDLPTGVEAPPPSGEPRRPRRPRDPQSAGGTGGGGTAQWPGSSDPMEQAAHALADGHPEECVDILDDVIARGGTSFALKRRGDCLMRAGRREEAIRDYQRFCRIAPDHPATGSVREQLAGMGLTCP